ncbi:MAG: hypothetical protein P8Y79_15260 [Ignavibacteriaceae bacterium]
MIEYKIVNRNVIKRRARIWEFQALSKISFVSGNKRLFGGFTKNALQSLDKFNQKVIKKEMAEMHKKIISQEISGSLDMIDVKKGSGGLTDIEFISQYLIITNPDLYGNSFEKSYPEQLQLISKAESKQPGIKILYKTFEFFKSIQLINQLIFTSTSSRIKFDGKRLNAFSTVLDHNKIDDFKNEILNNILNTKKLFGRVFK